MWFKVSKKKYILKNIKMHDKGLAKISNICAKIFYNAGILI